MPATPEAHSDILTQLRLGTRSHHDSIEKSIPVFRPDLDLANYRQILERFYGFYKPMEMVLGKKLDAIPELEFDSRKKLNLLEKDLFQLGKTPAEIAALSLCTDLPTATNLAEALGNFYVLEGSTLGGQFITKHVQKILNLNVATGGAFYASYGAATKSRWKEFQAVLTQKLTSPADQSTAIHAAQQTFQKLEAWMAAVAK